MAGIGKKSVWMTGWMILLSGIAMVKQNGKWRMAEAAAPAYARRKNK